MLRYLPLVAIVTSALVGGPIAFVWTMRATGLVTSPVLLFAAALTLSMMLSLGGAELWQAYGLREDLVFSDLLVWGFVRRVRQERALVRAVSRIGLGGAIGYGDAGESADQDRSREALERLAQVLEGQDRYLNGHSRRVARHATLIARELGFSDEALDRLRVAAALHDVGKLLTPSEILNKPARLTDEEFAVIKLHPVDGAAMVATLGDDELTEIVRHHHERLDGNGYPDRLAGEQIPLGARIVAVADTFDALTSARAYRGAARHAKAIAILREEAGKQLDPDAVHAFLSYYSGNRLAFKWQALVSGLRELIATLSGSPASAAVLPAGKAALVVGATIAVASAASVLPAAPRPHLGRPGAASARAAASAPGLGSASVRIALKAGVAATGWRPAGSRPAAHDRTRPAVRVTLPRHASVVSVGLGGGRTAGAGAAGGAAAPGANVGTSGTVVTRKPSPVAAATPPSVRSALSTGSAHKAAAPTRAGASGSVAAGGALDGAGSANPAATGGAAGSSAATAPAPAGAAAATSTAGTTGGVTAGGTSVTATTPANSPGATAATTAGTATTAAAGTATTAAAGAATTAAAGTATTAAVPGAGAGRP